MIRISTQKVNNLNIEYLSSTKEYDDFIYILLIFYIIIKSIPFYILIQFEEIFINNLYLGYQQKRNGILFLFCIFYKNVSFTENDKTFIHMNLIQYNIYVLCSFSEYFVFYKYWNHIAKRKL